MASALSQPKTLFRIASPLIHTDPDEILDIVRTTVMGAIKLDAGMYSEPMMYVPNIMLRKSTSDSITFKVFILILF